MLGPRSSRLLQSLASHMAPTFENIHIEWSSLVGRIKKLCGPFEVFKFEVSVGHLKYPQYFKDKQWSSPSSFSVTFALRLYNCYNHNLPPGLHLWLRQCPRTTAPSPTSSAPKQWKFDFMLRVKILLARDHHLRNPKKKRESSAV